MIGVILFYFCDSYFITLIFAPCHLPMCRFWHPMLGDSQN